MQLSWYIKSAQRTDHEEFMKRDRIQRPFPIWVNRFNNSIDPIVVVNSSPDQIPIFYSPSSCLSEYSELSSLFIYISTLYLAYV